MKTSGNAYEGENRSLHMKERIGYGVGDFANNMMYTPVNSFFTYFLTNVAGLGAGVVGTILLVSRLLDGVSDLIVGSFMEKIHGKHGKARPWLLWWCIPFAVSLVLMFTAPDFGTTGKIVYAFLTYNLAVTVVYTAINGIRVIFLYVPLVVFAVMFVVLLFYKLDKEYDDVITALENRK